MSPNASVRHQVSVATSVVVGMTGLAFRFLSFFVWRTNDDFTMGKLLALATLLLSGIPLALHGIHRARGRRADDGDTWGWEIALVIVGVVVVLLALVSTPPVIYEQCGFNGEFC